MSVFSERLKELRKEQNLTQQEIADKLHVNRVTYTNWEKGNREPNFKMLIQLADMLNVSTDYLLGREVDMITFSEQLKKYRTKKGLTQKELAEQIGIKQNSYSDWETGKNEPSLDNIVKLAKIFDTTTDDLLGIKNT